MQLTFSVAVQASVYRTKDALHVLLLGSLYAKGYDIFPPYDQFIDIGRSNLRLAAVYNMLKTYATEYECRMLTGKIKVYFVYGFENSIGYCKDYCNYYYSQTLIQITP